MEKGIVYAVWNKDYDELVKCFSSHEDAEQFIEDLDNSEIKSKNKIINDLIDEFHGNIGRVLNAFNSDYDPNDYYESEDMEVAIIKSLTDYEIYEIDLEDEDSVYNINGTEITYNSIKAVFSDLDEYEDDEDKEV